jgi:hypothetical protein
LLSVCPSALTLGRPVGCLNGEDAGEKGNGKRKTENGKSTTRKAKLKTVDEFETKLKQS